MADTNHARPPIAPCFVGMGKHTVTENQGDMEIPIISKKSTNILILESGK
jgi:hypothetical protein